MKILLTGHRGLVGSRVMEELSFAGADVYCLEVNGDFAKWHEDFEAFTSVPHDMYLHIGGIANNQYKDPDIFLWNTYASVLLAKKAREYSAPFVFFSSFLVSTSENRDMWHTRSPYGWSKAFAEEAVTDILDDYIVFRPNVIWGRIINDETPDSIVNNTSVPDRLVAKRIDYLFKNWQRSYVHVDDVVSAVLRAVNIVINQVGTFGSYAGVYRLGENRLYTNEELAAMTIYDDYVWVDNPDDVGHEFVSSHVDDVGLPSLPGFDYDYDVETHLANHEIKVLGLSE